MLQGHQWDSSFHIERILFGPYFLYYFAKLGFSTILKLSFHGFLADGIFSSSFLSEQTPLFPFSVLFPNFTVLPHLHDLHVLFHFKRSCSRTSSFGTLIFSWLATTRGIRWALLPSKCLPWPTSHPQLWSHSTCGGAYQQTHILILLGSTVPSLLCCPWTIPESWARLVPLPGLYTQEQGNMGSCEMKTVTIWWGPWSQPLLEGVSGWLRILVLDFIWLRYQLLV